MGETDTTYLDATAAFFLFLLGSDLIAMFWDTTLFYLLSLLLLDAF